MLGYKRLLRKQAGVLSCSKASLPSLSPILGENGVSLSSKNIGRVFNKGEENLCDATKMRVLIIEENFLLMISERNLRISQNLYSSLELEDYGALVWDSVSG